MSDYAGAYEYTAFEYDIHMKKAMAHWRTITKDLKSVADASSPFTTRLRRSNRWLGENILIYAETGYFFSASEMRDDQ